MGPPPRSLTAEANSCFMVRVLHGPNRIQGCGASIAPERGLPSDQLYRTSNNEGHRVAVTLDTKVLIQGCVKTCEAAAKALASQSTAPPCPCGLGKGEAGAAPGHGPVCG